jgi:DNA-binding NarL/FixJ family response regulator
MKRPRVLLADDHEMVAKGLEALLSEDYEVLGIVTDGAAVLGAVREHRPDLLLLDLTLPNRSGIDVLEDLQYEALRPRVLVVTMHVDHALMEAALRLGAAGFIPKDASGTELLGAVEEVLAGRLYVSPRVPKHGHRGGNAARMGFLRLTPRQQEIVHMLAQGMSSGQMAARLHLSQWTIHFHRKNIRRVLGIHSDPEMHRYAMLVEWGEEDAASLAVPAR